MTDATLTMLVLAGITYALKATGPLLLGGERQLPPLIDRLAVLLPAPLLHMIIRYGENVLHEFFENYLEQTINAYVTYKGKADEQFKKWLEVGMDLSEMSQQSLTRLNPFQAFFDQFPGIKPPPEESED